MTKANEYKAADTRGWREQAIPLHEKVLAMTDTIGAYLERVNADTLASTNTGLSRAVEAAVNYA